MRASELILATAILRALSPPPSPSPLLPLPFRCSSVSRSFSIFLSSKTAAAIAHMLHAPVELSIRNSKLEISRLLAGPSPNSSPRASQAPPSSRSISVPTSTPLYPLVTSPTPSTASHVSTATAPPTLYPQPERRTRGPSNLAAASRAPIVPPPRPNKRPPPDKPHSSASPAKKQSKWTPAEDAILIRLRLVDMGWEDISHHLPGRSMTSCRLHYQNYLEKRCNWDEEMSNKLARLYDRYVL